MNASINYLKTPDVLRNIWGLKVSGACAICACQQATLFHILAGCSTALDQKRYWWSHDCVLLYIQSVLVSFLYDCNMKASPARPRDVAPLNISFLAEGTPAPPPRRQRPTIGLLHRANDWKLLVDFYHDQYVFPPEIHPTTLRPDIVIWSPSLNMVIFIELTCPMEENCEARRQEKIARYIALIAEIEDGHRWKVVMHTIEVGARGQVHRKPAVSCFRSLGFSNRAISKIIKNLSLLSARASLAIYMARNKPIWEYLPTTALLRVTDCTLSPFELLRLRLSALTATESDWEPSFEFKKRSPLSPSAKSLDTRLQVIHENQSFDESPELVPLREPFTTPRNITRPNVGISTSTILVHTDPELCRPTPVQRETKLPEPMDDFDELIADAENFTLEPSPDGPSEDPNYDRSGLDKALRFLSSIDARLHAELSAYAD